MTFDAAAKHFSFSAESFHVNKVRDIEWNPDPFNTLVLPDGYKDLILSFVESHIDGDESFGDVIQGKGKGPAFWGYLGLLAFGANNE